MQNINPYKTATAVIDLKALVHNYRTIKSLAPNSQLLAVLKANAYGHGLALIAKALVGADAQADAFGVARIEEALALRAAGIVKPIVLLEGFFSAEDVQILAVNNFHTVVHNQTQLDAINAAELDEPLTVWLKVDTGMHRLGISPQSFDGFYQSLQASKNVKNEMVIMSHLGCADDIADNRTELQYTVFDKLTGTLHTDKKIQCSLANSAAICAFEKTHYDWIRPGLMLYGVNPLLPNDSTKPLDLKPVMTLYSSLIALRNIKSGESIGYGASWVCQKDTTIGVVAIGYGDGYPRHASNGTPVLINGRKVSLVGRVSMDMITVDLGSDCEDAIGDLVTLWGKGLPVAEIAEHSTTIPYELLCNITRRVNMELSD